MLIFKEVTPNGLITFGELKIGSTFKIPENIHAIFFKVEEGNETNSVCLKGHLNFRSGEQCYFNNPDTVKEINLNVHEVGI